MARDPWLAPEAVAMVTTDYRNHVTYEGHSFYYDKNIVNWDISNKIRLVLTTPDVSQLCYMVMNIEAARDTSVVLYEDTTHPVDVEQTTHNKNFNSVIVPGLKIYTAASGGDHGTEKIKRVFGITAADGEFRGGKTCLDVILKRNTKYFFIAETLTDDSIVSIRLDWQEHDLI